MGIEISRSNPNLEFPSDDHHVLSEREIFFASILGRKTRRRNRFFASEWRVSLFLIEAKLTVLREGIEGVVERLYSNEQ